MRKFLLFCFLSIWMAVSMYTASAYAQEGTSESCCFWLENEQPSRPENLYKMETAQIGATHIYTVHFQNSCNLPLDSKISLDWELLDANGNPVEDLRLYADLAFQIHVAGSSLTDSDSGRWVGGNVRSGMGRTSTFDPRPSDFPGFVMNDPANNLGSQDGYFFLTPENQYDYLYLHFLQHASDRDFIRVKIDWKRWGNFTLVVKLNERTGGTAHENYYLLEDQHAYYGGKQSTFLREIARFTLTPMIYGEDARSACSGDTIWAGSPAQAFVFNPIIPQPAVDTTFEVFYKTQECFGWYVDSIVNTRFQVAPIPPAPIVSGDLAICGVGSTQLTASSSLDTQFPGVYDVKYNWYTSLTSETAIYSGAIYTPQLDVEDTIYKFYVRSFITDDCESDALEVSVKVNKQPAVSINSELASYCPDGVSRTIEATPTNYYGPVSFEWTGAVGNASAQVATTDECGASYSYSVIVTDDATGCTATAEGSFTLDDTENPIVKSMSREVLATATECGEGLLPEYTTTNDLTAAGFEFSDNCSSELTVALKSTNALDAVDCKKVFVRTYTLTDHCNNAVDFNDTIFVIDNIAPTFDTDIVLVVEPIPAGTCEWKLPENLNELVFNAFKPTDNCSSVSINSISKGAGDLVALGETIIVTFKDECNVVSEQATFTVAVPTALSVVATADKNEECYDSELTFELTATPSNGVAPYSYSWTTDYEGASVINPTAATTEAKPAATMFDTQNISYNVIVTDANGCTASATVSIVVNALPDFLATSEPICYEDNATIIATSSAEYSITLKTPTDFTGDLLVVTNNPGEIQYHCVLPIEYTQQIFTQCASVDPAQCADFKKVLVEATNTTTGCKNATFVTVTVNDPFSYTTTDQNVNLCQGDTIKMAINTTEDYTYKWSVNVGDGYSLVSENSSYTTVDYSSYDFDYVENYELEITQTQNGITCKKYESFNFRIYPLPSFRINSGEDTIHVCLNENVALTCNSDDYTYIWSNNASTKSIEVEATEIGVVEYSVTATAAEGGCTSTQSVFVNTLPLPVIATQPTAEDASICTGDNTVLTVAANGATQYQWQKFDGSNWVDILSANAASYTTEPLYASTEAVTYKFRVVIANDGESYNGNNCHVVSDEVAVVANPAENVTIVTEEAAVCDNSDVVIAISNPNSDLTYQWQVANGTEWIDIDGEVGSSLNYSLTQTTQFRVIANNPVTNCSPISNELTIDTIARPIVQLLLDGQDADLYFCYRDSVIPAQINCLNSEAFIGHGFKYDFIVPARVEAYSTTEIIIKGVGDFKVGAYILDQTTGCSSDTVWHWIYAKGYPEYDFATVAPFCDGDTATMTIVPQEETYNYTWLSVAGDTLLNGAGEAALSARITGTQKFYTIVSAPHAVQNFSCSTLDSIEVEANPLPVFNITSIDPIEYCNSNKLGRIHVNNTTFSYQLSGADVDLVGDYFEVAEGGSYSVTAINNATGCKYSINDVLVDSLKIGFNVKLLIESVDADYIFACGAELPESLAVNVSYTKPADMDCTYSLVTELLQSPSNQEVIVAEHGVYTLGAYVTNTLTNCVSDTVYHKIIAVPTPDGTITSNSSICFGDSISLNYVHNTYDYLDSTLFSWVELSGAHNPSVVVKPTTTTTYHLSVTNYIGSNSCEKIYSVTVTVNPLPTIDAVVVESTCPNVENSLTADVSGTSPFVYSWNNNTSNSNIYTITNAQCGNDVNVSLVVTDSNNCSSIEKSITITSADATVPTFSTIPNLEIFCGTQYESTINTWLESAKNYVSDNCGVISLTNDFDLSSLPTNSCGSVRVKFIATDACGNVDSSYANISISDTVTPIISISSATIYCDTNATAFRTAVENWTNTLEVTTCGGCSTIAHNAFDVVENKCGTYEVIFNVSNCCASSISRVVTLTVKDTIAPVLNASALQNRTIYVNNSCTYDSSATAVENASVVTDNCARGLKAVYSDVVRTNRLGKDSVIVRTWTSEEDCGNNVAASHVQYITIKDTIKPHFASANENLELNCDATDKDLQVSNWLNSIAATDNCEIQSITNNYDVANLPTGCSRYDVTFTATDKYGNESTAVYTIISIDNSAPVINTISDLTVNYCATNRDSLISAWLNNVSATDCSGVQSIVNNYNVSQLPSVGCGTVSVEFIATDICGNTMSTPTIGTIIVVDTVKPTIIANNGTIECDATSLVSNFTTNLNNWTANFSANDGCGSSTPTISLNTTAVKDSCGSYNVSVYAEDACANKDSVIVTLTVIDTTKPNIVLRNKHRNIDLSSTCVYDASPVTGEISLSDNCSSVTSIYNDVEVIQNIYGADSLIVREWKSSPDCGNNIAVDTQYLHIIDGNAPSFSSLKVDSICKGSDYTPNVNYVASRITDNCADFVFFRNHLSYTTTTTSNADYVNDTTIITWTVNDNYHNTATATQMVIHFASPNVQISGTEQICEGSTTELTASVSNYSDVTYTWSNGVVAVSNNKATVSAGTYTVTATTALGCVGTASYTVTNYDIPDASISLPESICDNAQLTFTYSSDVAGSWNFVVTDAIDEVLSSTVPSGTITTSGSATAGSVVKVRATLTYADNCQLVVDSVAAAVKVGSYPKLLIKQGSDFASAIEDNNEETNVDAPVKFYLHVVPSDPACPPSPDLRVSIDYQFSKDGVVLDDANPLTNHLDDPNVPDPFYVTFKTKRYGYDYFEYTNNNGVFHYPYIAASYAGATHNFDYFRYEYIENREISVDISGFINSGDYDIDFQLVTHYHQGTTNPYGDAVPGYFDGVEVGGHQFYIHSFDVDTLAVNTMSIVVNPSPSIGVSNNTHNFGESFTHTTDELSVVERDMTIYPNPTTTDYLNVAFKNVTGRTIVRILNMNGKLVDQFEINILDEEYIYRYALDRVAPGVYFINAVSNDATFTKKVIIQNK